MISFHVKGQQGEIKHLYRSFVFIYSKMIIENSGIIVCKSRHIVLAGGGKVEENIPNHSFVYTLIQLLIHPFIH